MQGENQRPLSLPGPNQRQQEAIAHTDGPLLIIAGPGSGKTFTLVERALNLLLQGVAPQALLLATFTEKAAGELVTRISNRCLELGLKANLNEMYVGTLHSIFLRILEESREFTRLKRSYRVLDQFDQQFLVYRKIKRFLEIDVEHILLNPRHSRWRQAKAIIEHVNKVGEEYLDMEALKAAPEAEVQLLAHFFEAYDQLLAEENAIDFSFIQVETLRLLEGQPAVLQKLQEQLQYLMADEYQDTNTIQEKILLKLAGKHHNICVVGDDDQALYRFRGATVRNILEFPQHFPAGKCRRVTLDTNYRSHPGIIQFYNRWMERCDWEEGGRSFRFDKTIRPREGDFPEMPAVFKVSAEGTAENYHDEVYSFIRMLQAKGTVADLNQLAFLFKSVKNPKVIALANYLEGRGVPVFSPRSALFFEREEVQLMLGAIIFIFPDLFQRLKWDDGAFLPIWDYYEACKARFADALRADPETHRGLLQWCQARAKAHLTLSGKTTYTFTALLYQLLEYPLFARHLHNDLKGKASGQRAAYNIAMLTRLFHKFEYLDNVTVIAASNLDGYLTSLFNHFLRFIYDGGLEEYEDFEEYAPSGCVSFMTIHQSKGLEFPVAFVDSLYAVPQKQHTALDEILQSKYYHKPPFEPLDATKHFDFWRLYYTAFSRAQDLLILTTPENFEGRHRSPSKYFLPVYENLPYLDETGIDFGALKLNTIKPSHIKHEYSFTSHILLYENCPLQYKFYKELEFAEVRTGGVIGGTLLHHTIEDIHKAVLKGEVHTVTDENIESWFNTNYFLLVKQLRSYLSEAQRKSILSQVARYKNRMRHQWHIIKEAEVDVSLVKEDYILKGKIDLIQGEGDTVELIDFKSGNKPDVNDTDPHIRRALHGYRRQLEIYAHLVEERTGLAVSKMHLYYPKEDTGSPYITFSKDHSRIEETVRSFDEVVARIERKDFELLGMHKSEKLCGDCDMRYYCNPRAY